METTTLIVYYLWVAMIVASIVAIGKGRVKVLNGKFWAGVWDYSDDLLDYEETEMPFGYFIPLLAVGIFEILVMILCPDVVQLLDAATPSFHSNNWIWTIIAAYFAPLPLGFQLFLIVNLFNKTEPESEILKYSLIVVSIVGLGCAAYVFAEVYSWWALYLPVVCGAVYMLGFWPLTSTEKANRDTKIARRASTSSASVPSSRPSRSSSSSSGSRRASSGYREDTSSRSREDENDSRNEYYRREAEEYLRQARQYEDEASRLESEAESNIRSAEDNEYWGREYDDSFKLSAARDDRSRAASQRYQAEQARSQASRYYSLYEDALSKCR